MFAWKAIYGSYLSVSPIGPEVRWWAPRLSDILWSSRHGLFATSPVVYLGAIGLGVLAWQTPAFGVPALMVFAAMTWLNASLQDWWGSASFGMRRFDGVLPFVATGAAALLHAASIQVARRPQATVAVAAAGGLVLWNLTFMEATLAGVVPMDDPVAFEHVAARQGATLERWFGHPFSYPANLVFAIRNGRSPAAYDVLWVGRFLADPTKPYGRLDIGSSDGPWIDEGWYDPEAQGDITFRWAQGRAVIALPLDHAAALRVVVRAMPFSWPASPPQSLSLEVNGTVRARVPLADGWQDAPMEVAEDAWRSGVNEVALVFGRSARPADVGVSQDRRALAAAVDWIRVAVADEAGRR